MASQLGKTGGRSTSAAKTAASRSNGKLGGRPKKKPLVADAAQRSDYMTKKKETIKSLIKKELTKPSEQLRKGKTLGERVMAEQSVAVREGVAKPKKKKSKISL